MTKSHKTIELFDIMSSEIETDRGSPQWLAVINTLSTWQNMVDIAKQLDRIERKLDMLLKKAYRPFWVKATIITHLTGWNRSKMQDAREYGYIKYEIREKDGKKEYWYDLNSIHEKFLKQQS